MNGCQPSKAQDGTAQSANHVATFAVYRDNIIYLFYLSNLGSYRELQATDAFWTGSAVRSCADKQMTLASGFAT
jgi:hypothetical protein